MDGGGQHHLHVRKRLFAQVPTFPHPERFKRYLDYGMYGVGILAPIAVLPQVIQIFATQDAGGLSPITWILIAIINSLWSLYGFVHKEWPICLSNAALAVLNVVTLVGIALYH